MIGRITTGQGGSNSTGRPHVASHIRRNESPCKDGDRFEKLLQTQNRRTCSEVWKSKLLKCSFVRNEITRLLNRLKKWSTKISVRMCRVGCETNCFVWLYATSSRTLQWEWMKYGIQKPWKMTIELRKSKSRDCWACSKFKNEYFWNGWGSIQTV